MPSFNTSLSLSPIASYLQTRSWQGLEVKLGDTRPSEVIEGMRGVATHYTHEDHVYTNFLYNNYKTFKIVKK